MRVSKWLVGAAVGVCVAALAGRAAAAQDEEGGRRPRNPDAPPRPDIMTWDADGDGKVSFEEFKAGSEAMLRRRFEMLDADKDGFISSDEAQAARGRAAERMRQYQRGEGAQRPAATEGGRARRRADKEGEGETKD